MPLPLILGAAALFAGAGGIGQGIWGTKSILKSRDKMKEVEEEQKQNLQRYENYAKEANTHMDNLGRKELEILQGFESFSNVIEKIQNKPQFIKYEINGSELPKYEPEELKKIAIGAGALVSGAAGAGLGTLGGFAAAGVTQSAVMALGTASTGTAISTLSGAAAANASLAAIGGGSLAAGGGGVALGTTILGAATGGVALLVAGSILNYYSKGTAKKADEAEKQMKETEKQVNQVCSYLKELTDSAKVYLSVLDKVFFKYDKEFTLVYDTVVTKGITDWNAFSEEKKINTQNSVLLVSLLWDMCKLQLVSKSKSEDDLNTINKFQMEQKIAVAKNVLSNIDSSTIPFEVAMFSKEDAIEYNRIAAIINMAIVDGYLSSDEYKMLKEHISKLSLEQKYIDKLVQQLEGKTIVNVDLTYFKSDDFAAEKLLTDLISIMKADGEMHEKEVEYFKTIAKELQKSDVEIEGYLTDWSESQKKALILDTIKWIDYIFGANWDCVKKEDAEQLVKDALYQLHKNIAVKNTAVCYPYAKEYSDFEKNIPYKVWERLNSYAVMKFMQRDTL